MRSCGSVVEVVVTFITQSGFGNFEKSRLAHFIDIGIGTQSSWIAVFWPERHLLIYAVTDDYQQRVCGKWFLHSRLPKRAKNSAEIPLLGLTPVAD
jgi:hypothetical protein